MLYMVVDIVMFILGDGQRIVIILVVDILGYILHMCALIMNDDSYSNASAVLSIHVDRCVCVPRHMVREYVIIINGCTSN